MKLAIDFENDAEGWWYAAEQLRGDAPPAFLPLLDDLAVTEITVTESEADAILDWAHSLPCWDTGPDHARHPLIVVRE